MTRTPSDPDWLDAALDDLARMDPPPPSEGLTARVLADAQTLQPHPTKRLRTRSLWQRVLGHVGTWSAAGGLVAAAVTGFVIGLGSTGIDAYLPMGEAAFYDNADGLAAFGWDLGDG